MTYDADQGLIHSALRGRVRGVAVYAKALTRGMVIDGVRGLEPCGCVLSPVTGERWLSRWQTR